MKEKLLSYVEDLKEDLSKDEKEYSRLFVKIDNCKSKKDKIFLELELANVSGRRDTTKDIIECLEYLLKED